MPEHHTHQVTTDKLEEAVKSLSQDNSTLNTKIDTIHASLTAKIEALFDRFASFTVNSPPPPPPTPLHASSAPYRHHMKLEVPRFDGHDPLGWIFKISQFFDYQGIPDHERLTVASFYMEGPALSWYQWMCRNGFFPSWPAMLQALESRFAPSFYDDPQGALFKLQQTGSVSEYLTDFERLANRTLGLPPSCLLSCFVSGLIPELRREVQALRPMSLPHATELVRLQEDKLLDRRRGQRTSSTSFSPKPTTNQPPPSTRVPIKRLTSEELAVRHEQGLCYHCEEKWSHGHRCKPRLHLFIADDEPDSSADTHPNNDPPPSGPDLPITPHISLNAMEGTPAPQTFRLLGTVRRHPVVILVDGGSTHNFIQSRLARFLALSATPTPALRVMVGDGNTLECDTQSLQVPISIQDHTFTLDLFHLPLCGADLVLGVQWLKLLGPITTDYQQLTMTFSHLGRNITLRADAPPSLSPASAHQLKRLA